MVVCLERGADMHMAQLGWHCHSLSLASVKSRLVLPFWYQLTWVVPDTRLTARGKQFDINPVNPFPSPSLLSPSLPFHSLPLLFSVPFLTAILPFLKSLPLELGPLNTARGSGRVL